MRKLISALLCASLLAPSCAQAFPASAFAVDYGVEASEENAGSLCAPAEARPARTGVLPVAAGGFAGETTDVDPRYPGAYYTFADKIDGSTLTKEALAASGAAYFELDGGQKTVVLYPTADKTGAGKTVTFPAFDSDVRTTDGEPLSFPAVTLSYAARYDGGGDLAPYGDGNSVYPGIYADPTYTLSSGGGLIEAKTAVASSYKPFLFLPLPFEVGATYRISVKLRITDMGSKTAKAFVNPIFVYGGATHALTGFNLAVSDEYTEKTFEHTVEAFSDRASPMGFRMTTNPVRVRNTVVTAPSYEIAALSAYRRLDVTYEAGEYCVLADGNDAPAPTVGVYLDGSAADTTVTITAETPFVPSDDRFSVDWTRPWRDEDGNTYARGDTVDLAQIGKALVLTPNVVTDVPTVSLRFDHTGLAAYPDDRAVFEGDTVSLAGFDGFASERGKRFCGWSLSEGGARVDTVTLTEDVTLYPLISYDCDFSFADAMTGLATSGVSAERKDGALALSGASANAFVTFGGVLLPAYAVRTVRFVFEGEENPVKLVYFNTGTSYNADGKVKTFAKNDARTETVEEDGGTLLAVTFNTEENADWRGSLQFLRLDVSADCRLLRVEFDLKDAFEETAVELVGFPAPVTGAAAPKTLVDANGLAEAAEIIWSPALLAGDVFDSDTAYTAEVHLAPKALSSRIFAPGTTVSVGAQRVHSVLNDNGELVFGLSFDKTAAVPRHTVFFDGTGLAPSTVPAPVSAFEGTDFSVSAFNTARSGIAGLRFNGWALKKGEPDTLKALDTVPVDGDITLYPILNYDFNFACPDSRSGWTPRDEQITMTYTDRSVVVASPYAGMWLWRYDLNLPAKLFDGVAIYYEPSGYNPKTSYIYFSRPGEGETTERFLNATRYTKGVDADTGLQRNLYPVDGHGLWTDTIARLRFDLFTDAGSTELRAIVFTRPAPMRQSAFALDGITVPAAGKPDTTETDFSEPTQTYISLDHVEWQPALADGRFEAHTVYTANVYLSPRPERRFDENADYAVTFGDRSAVCTVEPLKGTLCASFTFEETGDCEPVSLHIASGEETVYVDGKAHPYSVGFDGDASDKAVKWTVSNTDDFAVDENTGALTVKKNVRAETTLRVTSRLNPSAFDEMTVRSELYGFTATVEGPAVISKAGRVTQYTLKPHGDHDIYDKSAVWSVDDKSVAEIDEKTGRLVPYKDGTVTVTAVSNYDPAVSASLEVAVSGQGEPFDVRFHPGTDDIVTDMPQDTEASGRFTLPQTQPKREGYVFLGWAVGDESFDPVEYVCAECDLYALWSKGVMWTFGKNGDTHPEDLEELDDRALGEGNGYGYYRYMRLNVLYDAGAYNAVILRSAYEKADATRLYYKARYTDETGKSVDRGYETNFYQYAEKLAHGVKTQGGGLEDFHNYCHNMTTDHDPDDPGKWSAADKIVSVYFDLVRSAGTKFAVKYIFFGDTKRTVTFEANTSDAVEDLPEPLPVVQGDTVKITGVPTRKGYRFAGWSKVRDSRDDVRDAFGIVDDLTLYAVWDKAVESENERNGKTVTYAVGTVDPESDGEALFVQLSSGVATAVKLTYTDENGEEKTLNATTNAAGRAVFDPEGKGRLSDAVLSVNAPYTFASVTLTDASSAEKMLAAVEQKPKNDYNPRFFADRYRGWVIGEVDQTVTDLASGGETVNEPQTDTEPQTDESEIVRFPQVVFGRIPFTDVKTAQWFREEVVNAYRLGLVKGRTEELFDPFGEVTVAEAVTLAVRVNRAYNGLRDDVASGEGEAWYTGYVEEAVRLGVIEKDRFADFDKPAERREVAVIMRMSVPDEYLPLINRFSLIPDMDKSDPDFASVLRLYNTGIAQGDEAFNFLPDTTVTRAEIAAMLNRIAHPEERKRNITEKERQSRTHTYAADTIAAGAKLVNCTADKMTLTQEGTALAEAKNYDPIVFFGGAINLVNASVTTRIRVGMKWEPSVVADPVEAGCAMYFQSADSDEWLVSNRLDASWDGTLDENGFADIVFDCTQNKAFAGTVADLRFKPFGKSGAFEIAYLVIE